MSANDVARLLGLASDMGALHLNAKREVETLRAIQEWAIASLKLDYKEGDEVVIVHDDPHSKASRVGSGWHDYREALLPGACLAKADRIYFNTFSKQWQVEVGLIDSWSTHYGTGSRIPAKVRYWNGLAASKPEGDNWQQGSGPGGAIKVFSLDVHDVANVLTAGTRFAATLAEADRSLWELCRRRVVVGRADIYGVDNTTPEGDRS